MMEPSYDFTSPRRRRKDHPHRQPLLPLRAQGREGNQRAKGMGKVDWHTSYCTGVICEPSFFSSSLTAAAGPPAAVLAEAPTAGAGPPPAPGFSSMSSMFLPERTLLYNAPQYGATELPEARTMALMLSADTATPPSWRARIASDTTRSSFAEPEIPVIDIL